jgi:iron(III) transport system substrate-binding protein
MGLLQPVDSPILDKAVPEAFRDPEGFWFGFSLRARTIIYNKTKVKPEQLTTYAALAGPEWKDKLLLRTSKKVYNQSLTAMLMAQHGETKTEEIVRGWVGNLAAPPFANDTSLIKALASGAGEVGIVNTYYLGRLLKNDSDLPIGVFWPDQSEDGVHVNVSGAGLGKHAKNRDAAINLMEWLTSPKAQKAFAGHNMEYPVVDGVALDPIVAEWGSFTSSKMNLAKAGELQGEAIKLMDRAGYK